MVTRHAFFWELSARKVDFPPLEAIDPRLEKAADRRDQH